MARLYSKGVFMKKIKAIAFAAMILVLAGMFTGCETVAAGIYKGVKTWQEDPNNPLNK